MAGGARVTLPSRLYAYEDVAVNCKIRSYLFYRKSELQKN